MPKKGKRGNYLQGVVAASIPQSEPLRDDQVQNHAGGYAWQVTPWQQLERFLILGSEGGTYYVEERQLTLDHMKNSITCLQEDGSRFVDMIKAISVAGRAPKNTPAIFALAIAIAKGDTATRQAAYKTLPEVCRIGTHLFQFAGFVKAIKGNFSGTGLRRAISRWYRHKKIGDVAYQMLKYQQREGWSHRDMLRLSHPKPADDAWKLLFGFATAKKRTIDADGNLVLTHYAGIKGQEPIENMITAGIPEQLSQVEGYMRIQAETDPQRVATLIRKYRMTREFVPTQLLTERVVWEALLEHMPMTALIRNLATLTRLEIIKPLAKPVTEIAAKITDQEAITKARIHPIAILSALRTYERGMGIRGQHSWKPVEVICDALEEAYYLAFKNIEPTGKRYMLAIDVSGSMGSGEVAGVVGLTPRVAAAAMAMVTVRTESNYHVMAFDHLFEPLLLTKKDSLKSAIKKTSDWHMGGTDCALPMLYATEHNLEVDVFVVYTDSETWCGKIHPAKALDLYRQKSGIPAKLIVCAMVSTKHTIADPLRPYMLDIVGFDTTVPQVIREFSITDT